ncbi:hypothetical protein MUK42_37097 [Musa troglodytarum]|uniref:Uncharacterized protein n=1 Tax=Musa troglodytarum TaxID=320322 RepID=A0A9E7J9Y1_9LILI|nr:hypothetical protein MUK42_37097 [Musa troglodytarum]
MPLQELRINHFQALAYFLCILLGIATGATEAEMDVAQEAPSTVPYETCRPGPVPLSSLPMMPTPTLGVIRSDPTELHPSVRWLFSHASASTTFPPYHTL